MGRIVVCIIFMSCFFFANAQDIQSEVQNARELFQRKSYDEAYKVYLNISKKLPKNHTYWNEMGQAAYKAKDYSKAAHYFINAQKKERKKQLKSDLNHNLGNAYYQQKEYSKAVDAYKQALRKNPQDEQTRYNLALAMKKSQKNKQNQNKPSPPKSNNQPNEPPKNKPENSKSPQNNSTISDQKTDQMLDDLMKKEMETKQNKAKKQPSRNDTQNGKDW